MVVTETKGVGLLCVCYAYISIPCVILLETLPIVRIIGFLMIYNFNFVLDGWCLADYITLGLWSVE